MAWRFKVSKYKNAAAVLPKKEDWISDIKVGAPTSCGNHIKASGAFVAFCVENRGGGSLGVVPLDYKGRLDSSQPLLHGHSDLITDFDFSPFDDGLLATGSTDAYVRLWNIPEKGLKENLTDPEYCLPQFDKRIENVCFHPTVDFLLTVAHFDTVKLWDIKNEKQVYCFSEHEDQVQSCSWRANGSLFTTTAKDKIIRIIDPRSKTVAHWAESHKICKDSRVVWLGDTDRVLSTGFDAQRTREVKIRDLRCFNKPLKVQSFDSSTGILMPLFDPDTNMLFLVGKADVTIMYWEVLDKEPYLIEGLKHNGTMQTKGACLVPKRGLNVMSGEVNRVLQLTSSAVIPLSYQVPRKSYREFHSDLFPETPGVDPSMTISQWLGGANRPRIKLSLDPSTYQDESLQIFRGPLNERSEAKESELCQETALSAGKTPGPPVPAPRLSISNGLKHTNKENGSDNKFSQFGFAKPFVAVKETDAVDNANELMKKFEKLRKNSEDGKNDFNSVLEDSNSNNTDESTTDHVNIVSNSLSGHADVVFRQKPESVTVEKSPELFKRPYSVEASVESSTQARDDPGMSAAERRKTFEKRFISVEEKPSSPIPRRVQGGPARSFRRVCKFRHLKGTPAHKSFHIDNLRDINRTIPGECDGIAANALFVALPLSGPGGKVSIIRHQIGGRLPDGVIPSLVNGASVLDFEFDPFNDRRLAAACDDGKVRFWTIPEDGLKTPTNEPSDTCVNSLDKVTIIRWHPLASEIFATASGDFLVRIWDLENHENTIALESHADQIFSMDWSPCGRFLATVCRDGKIRIFDPRKSVTPSQEGNGPPGVRGARILWVLDGQFILVCGFSKISERQITLFKSNDLNKSLNTLTIDVNPSILIPCYDFDSSTLFVTGKGDGTIYAYEIGSDAPHLFPLSHHKCSSVHQAFAILPKLSCDVRQVEFCRGFRLTQNTLEPLSFTVPRIKTEYFQDDLFPDTHLTTEPVLTSGEWLSGVNKPPKLVSLRPSDMRALSESRDTSSPSIYVSSTPSTPSNVSQPKQFQLPSVAKGTNMNTLEIKETRERLQNSMNRQLDSVALSKEQDRMEGVDSKEWDD